MPITCPNCGHEFKDPARVKGGLKSKRTDMKKGSSGQKKAQEGRLKKDQTKKKGGKNEKTIQ